MQLVTEVAPVTLKSSQKKGAIAIDSGVFWLRTAINPAAEYSLKECARRLRRIRAR
jgi:hypothetical protein